MTLIPLVGGSGEVWEKHRVKKCGFDSFSFYFLFIIMCIKCLKLKILMPVWIDGTKYNGI
jgi:hypothetical protein